VLRLVFLSFAEAKGLQPAAPFPSIQKLHQSLCAAATLHPASIEQRTGAWTTLCDGFRQLHSEGQWSCRLFDPAVHPFLEVLRISDGCLLRVLDGVRFVNGEPLSYRDLEVEQLGRFYESMMGFEVKRAAQPSIGLKPHNVVIGVEDVLRVPPTRRGTWLAAHAGCRLSKTETGRIQSATTAAEVFHALTRKRSPHTPELLQTGSLYLQPGNARRHTGSHYTPRSLTVPIVQKTLQPVLATLGEHPTPEQILDLKVCDMAMGTGAFLLESCRQLGDALVSSLRHHGRSEPPNPEQDPLHYARQQVAVHCLYGVDKNAVAIDLAGLSLWLLTRATTHPLDFACHSLRHGDALVGLQRHQIERFNWHPNPKPTLKSRPADSALRLKGDLLVAAFFASDGPSVREETRHQFHALWQRSEAGDTTAADAIQDLVHSLRSGKQPVLPLHWPMAFRSVFERENPGFDAVVGNPPFAGVVQLAAALGTRYSEYLRMQFPPASGQVDIAAFFFRRCFSFLRNHGALGLVATNTIGQGDTRECGLRVICENQGVIYDVDTRIPWPGQANVILSRIHISRGRPLAPIRLNGRNVSTITALLLTNGGHHVPPPLPKCPIAAAKGVVPWGVGFVSEAGKSKGIPWPEFTAVLAAAPAERARVRRFVGGAELNTVPTLSPERFIVDLDGLDEAAARQFPGLFQLLETHVKPQRQALPDTRQNRRLKAAWWHFSQGRQARASVAGLPCFLVMARVSRTFAFAFLPKESLASEQLVILPSDSDQLFAIVQSRVHETWARAFGSSMKDDLRYTPSRCLHNFPFPEIGVDNRLIEAAGASFYAFRSALMVQENAGLTKIHNRIHDPSNHTPAITELRALYAAMDRTVLDAYGWQDIPTDCLFLFSDDADTTKKAGTAPCRFRWPNPVRDEVLARLLALHEQRYDPEVALGLHKTGKQRGNADRT